MTAAICISNLTHNYPPPRKVRRRGLQVPCNSSIVLPENRPALDNVGFNIGSGEIFGILGPNGSGKTSLFRVISTLMRPTSGNVHVFDYDVQSQGDQVRRQLGIVFQTPSLDLKLTAEENMLHQGRLYGLRGDVLRQRLAELLTAFGLDQRRSEYVERFSGGMRRRLELAKAMLHRPRLLMMDEPATGLDPGARRDLWTHLHRLHEQGDMTIVLTTHLMDEADYCHRLAVLNEGKLAALDTPVNLKSRIGADVITVDPHDAGDAENLCRLISGQFGPWPDGAAPVVHRGKIHLQKADGPAFVPTLSAAIAARTRSVTVGRATLEDVFLHLTGHTLYK